MCHNSKARWKVLKVISSKRIILSLERACAVGCIRVMYRFSKRIQANVKD